MTAAVERVEASRARLRMAMLPPPPVEKVAGARVSMMDRLLQIPVVGAVIESVQAWWSIHPLRPMSKVASEATTAAVTPIARYHPLLLMLASAGAGALIFWTRPWRWIFRTALFSGLVPQLLTRAVASLPIDSWMSIFGSVTPRKTTNPTDPVEPFVQAATG